MYFFPFALSTTSRVPSSSILFERRRTCLRPTSPSLNMSHHGILDVNIVFDFGVNCSFNRYPGSLCLTLSFRIVYEHFSHWCPLHVINTPSSTLRSKRRSHWGDQLGRRHGDDIYMTEPWLLIVGKTANSKLWCKIRHLMAVFFLNQILLISYSVCLSFLSANFFLREFRFNIWNKVKMAVISVWFNAFILIIVSLSVISLCYVWYLPQ